MSATTISNLPALFLYATFHAIAAVVDVLIDATIWLTSGLTERVEWLFNSNNRSVIGELINVYLDTSFRLDSGSAIVAWINSNPGSHHLDKTKIVPISDLHSFVSNSSEKNYIVIVRGLVRSKSPLVSSHGSQGQAEGVALQKTVTCNAIMGLISGLRSKSSLEKVPFVLSPQRESDISLNVKFNDSTHPIPFTTINRHSQRTTYRFLGHEYHVKKVIEEKLLPLDKEITAVGKICISEDGVLEINPCKDLPYFLSDQTRTEASNIWLQKLTTICVGVLLVLTSLQLLKSAFTTIWWQRKERWQDRRVSHQSEEWGRGIPRDEVEFWVKNTSALAIAFGLTLSVHLLKRSNIWRENIIAPIQMRWEFLKKLMRQVRNYLTEEVRTWRLQCMQWVMQGRDYAVRQVREQLPFWKNCAIQVRDYVKAEVQKRWPVLKGLIRQLTKNVVALLQRWLQELPVDQQPRNVTRVQNGNTPPALSNAPRTRPDRTDEGIPEEQLCVICLENRKGVAFFPCGHVICCQNCTSSVRQAVRARCPLCRRFISYSLPVYL